MSRSTNKIGAGANAVATGLKMISGADVAAYRLEFITASKRYPANTHQTIVVPYIELGRDTSCVIHFGDDLPMVSRKHAAIEQRGQELFLKQLSQTNQTLINGRPINQEWYLTNGDEIQLSASGPRIRYVTSQAKTSTMGVSKRIHLFAQQALRPYRRALITLLGVFFISAAVATYLIIKLRTQNMVLQQAYKQIGLQTEQQQEAIKKGDSLFLVNQRQMAEKIAAENQEKNRLQEEIKRIETALEQIKKTPPPAPPKDVLPVASKGETLPQMIEQVRKHVYFIKMYLTVDGHLENAYVGSGTGFMLNDGRFVTARHCVQPWAFASMDDQRDENWILINWLYYNHAKGSVKLSLEITSPDGKSIFVAGDKFISTDTDDYVYADIDVGYGPGKIQLASLEDGKDWAYYTINSSTVQGIFSDPKMATDLKSGTLLHVLGYTFGLGNSAQAPSPVYSTANVSQNGLINGLINVTNLGFAEGNSGGPVFVEKDGQLVNIGLVSAKHSVLGMVVPISALKEGL